MDNIALLILGIFISIIGIVNMTGNISTIPVSYTHLVPIKPGLREYLDRCRAAGERMIVLTSSVPEHCRAALGPVSYTPLTGGYRRR